MKISTVCSTELDPGAESQPPWATPPSEPDALVSVESRMCNMSPGRESEWSLGVTVWGKISELETYWPQHFTSAARAEGEKNPHCVSRWPSLTLTFLTALIKPCLFSLESSSISLSFHVCIPFHVWFLTLFIPSQFLLLFSDFFDILLHHLLSHFFTCDFPPKGSVFFFFL